MARQHRAKVEESREKVRKAERNRKVALYNMMKKSKQQCQNNSSELTLMHDICIAAYRNSFLF